MSLELTDHQFLSKREKFVKAWPWLGGALIVGLLGYVGFLWFTKPLLANPIYVLEQLQQDAIPDATLVLMAGMLPEAILMCFGLAAALLAFSFSVMATEKRYLRLIAQLQRDSGKSEQERLTR